MLCEAFLPLRRAMAKDLGTRAVLFLAEKKEGASLAEVCAGIGETDPKRVEGRLRFMSKMGNPKIRFEGVPSERRWFLVEGAELPSTAPAYEDSDASTAVVDRSLGGRSKGWKPSVDRLSLIEEPVGKGVKLLVVYPESWRSSVVVEVRREPDDMGAVLAWDMNNSYHCFVPGTVAACDRTGIKSYVLNSKTLQKYVVKIPIAVGD